MHEYKLTCIRNRIASLGLEKYLCLKHGSRQNFFFFAVFLIYLFLLEG